MPFSDNFLQQAYNGGGDPIIDLMRVQFEDQTLYFANNNENITSTVTGTEQTFLKSAFKLALPDETEEGTPRAKLNFEAADSQIMRLLRETDDIITFDIWLVLGSDVNAAEYGPVNYQSASISINANAIEIELEVEPILQVQLPRERFTPNTFPGLFDGT